jgi:N-acetyl-anhydromuramyl-L-alanine amidase AmpD
VWARILLLIAEASLAGPAPAPTIVDRPITYDARRIALTVDYRRLHEDPAARDQRITPRAIVVHHTGGNSARQTIAYFDRLEIEDSRERTAAAGSLNVSSHFVIDRDGTIYRLMPETWFARHCIGLNHVAIGIENVGDDKRWRLTDAQLAANAALVRDLVRRYPTITTLLGHHEYRRLEHAPAGPGGAPLFVERDPRYRNHKPDPGPAFMTRLRARAADLALAEPPAPARPPSRRTAR